LKQKLKLSSLKSGFLFSQVTEKLHGRAGEKKPDKEDFMGLANRVEEFTLRFLDCLKYYPETLDDFSSNPETNVILETAIKLEQKKVIFKRKGATYQYVTWTAVIFLVGRFFFFFFSWKAGRHEGRNEEGGNGGRKEGRKERKMGGREGGRGSEEAGRRKKRMERGTDGRTDGIRWKEKRQKHIHFKEISRRSNKNGCRKNDLRTFLLLVYFSQSSLHLSYLHLSYLTLLSLAVSGPLSHMNLVIWPRSPRVTHSSVDRASKRTWKVMGSTPVGRTQTFSE